MDAKSRALIELGRLLQLRGYRFVAVAPSTHDRVLRREEASPSLESIFGWSRPFDREAIDGYLVERLEQADDLETEAGRYKSKVRFASIDDLLFVHSAFPTTEPDSILNASQWYCAQIQTGMSPPNVRGSRRHGSDLSLSPLMTQSGRSPDAA